MKLTGNSIVFLIRKLILDLFELFWILPYPALPPYESGRYSFYGVQRKDLFGSLNDEAHIPAPHISMPQSART